MRIGLRVTVAQQVGYERIVRALRVH